MFFKNAISFKQIKSEYYDNCQIGIHYQDLMIKSIYWRKLPTFCQLASDEMSNHQTHALMHQLRPKTQTDPKNLTLIRNKGH